MFETVFTLERQCRAPKKDIRASLTDLFGLRGLEITWKDRMLRALDLYVERNMSFGDAYNVALMQQLGIEEIASFDRDFDRVPGIRRVKPR